MIAFQVQGEGGQPVKQGVSPLAMPAVLCGTLAVSAAFFLSVTHNFFQGICSSQNPRK